ncbi:MAG: glycine oxidase ThiO [Candidatus Competibacteraceae bacterium]
MPSIGIAGAGLVGRLLAFALLRKGWRITLLDSDRRTGGQSAAIVAAGMLAPYAELETAEPLVFNLGKRSLELWPPWLAALEQPVFFQQTGTLLIAHRQDRADMERFVSHIHAKLGERAELQSLDATQLAELEPELAGRFQRGVWFPGEGQIAPSEFLPAVADTLLQGGVNWLENTPVEAVSPGELKAGGQTWKFDWVIDARGMGAKADIPKLRGVRGEIVTVQAPEVNLHRMVRLMHPRYAIYIAPRPDHQYVIGATSIDSEDRSPISVQSLLELLSAAYTVHSGFAEARLLKTATQLRPALPDHLPRLFYRSGLLRINGLYRHGYLQGPAVVEDAVRLLEAGTGAMHFPDLLREEPPC